MRRWRANPGDKMLTLVASCAELAGRTFILNYDGDCIDHADVLRTAPNRWDRTFRWWPMLGCSFRSRWPSTWVCVNWLTLGARC